MEKVIVVKQGKIVEKEGKFWVELVDQDDKTHRIFASIQTEDGKWIHLEKEIDILKGYIEANQIEGKAFKLIKEKKGQYWNVVSVEEVKNIIEKEAAENISKQMVDNRDRSMSTSYAKDLLCAGRIQKHELLDWIEFFYKILTGQIGGSDEGVIAILRKMIPDEVAEAYKEAKAIIPTEGKIIPQKGISEAPTEIVPIEDGVALDMPAWINEFKEGIERKHWKFITLKGYLVSHFPSVDFKGVANEVDAMALLTDEQRNIVLKALK